MKRAKRRPLPNYVRKLTYLQRTGAFPRTVGVHMVEIFHDDWCGQWQGQRCNCNPDIRLKYSLPASDN